MMALYAPVECNCLLQRNQFGNILLLGRINNTARILWIRLPFILIIQRYRIDPSEYLFTWFLTSELVLNYLTHLSIKECVSYDHFFFL